MCQALGLRRKAGLGGGDTQWRPGDGEKEHLPKGDQEVWAGQARRRREQSGLVLSSKGLGT